MSDDSRMKTDFAVHLDGNKLQGEEAAAILGIRVFQTRTGASAFEVVVSDPELKWQGKPTFTDCKEVKIELGAAGKLKKVFDGEVTAWRTELERSGPSVLVLRGLDRSHRLMRVSKTKTYANATPIDCAKQIAGQYGLTAKTRPGTPAPVKMFRFQANQTDFDFLRALAELEGYMFWIEGSELHFERPEISSTDDAEFSFGEDVKTFLPVANFRKPPAGIEVGAWDVSGKAELTGNAKTGDELWSVPGVKPGAKLARFTSSKPEGSLVESQVGTQEHADTVAKAELTRRAMEFITAEVEVQGNPVVKPGAMVNIKKVGPYSGHYLVTEANHFYDAAGYNCIFYVARDKWGNSSNPPASTRAPAAAKAPAAGGGQPASAKRGPGPSEGHVHQHEPGKSTAVTLAAAAELGVPFSEEGERARQELAKAPTQACFLTTVIRAIGGTPLMHQPVQVIDPDTGEEVGEPLSTDAEGRIAVRVPENKKYGIRILDDDPGDDLPPPEAMDPYDPAQDDPPQIFVRLLDAAGKPLAGIDYEVTGKGGFSHKGKTDAEGDVEMEGVPAGGYELKIQGRTLQIPTIVSSVLREDPTPYTLVVN